MVVVCSLPADELDDIVSSHMLHDTPDMTDQFCLTVKPMITLVFVCFLGYGA